MEHLTNADIDAMLDEARPDRYDLGDNSWRADTYAEVAEAMPAAEARRLAACQLVDQREGIATRAANALLREIGRTQQWPMHWFDVARRTISVGPERVCLAVATTVDLRQWAIDERREAAQDFSARSAACDGAEWAADCMDAGGHTTFAECAEAKAVDQ